MKITRVAGVVFRRSHYRSTSPFTSEAGVENQNIQLSKHASPHFLCLRSRSHYHSKAQDDCTGMDMDDEDVSLEEERLHDLCASLIANDPEITEVSTHYLPIGYGRRLGEALLVNTVVTELSLDVSSFFRESDQVLDDGEFMLSYLRGSSASLKKVHVWRTGPFDHDLGPEMTDQIHAALASNPHIEHLITISNVTNNDFALVVRNSTSIRNLEVQFVDYFESAGPRRLPLQPLVSPVPLAFEANQALESLTLCAHGNFDMTGVLRVLATHPKLTDLRLAHWYYDSIARDNFHALAHLLMWSQTIQSLALDGYDFDKDAMELVLAALQSNKVVAKLTVLDCKFDEQATGLLLGFMQTHANKGDSVLREFRLESRGRRGLPQFLPEERSVSAVLLSMVSAGSSLERLSIGEDIDGFDATEFLTRLAIGTVEGTMKLSGLVLDQELSRAELEALATYLRQTAYLRDLSIGGLDDDLPASRRRLVSAIRSNGSLLNFTGGASVSTDATVSRLIGACLERNRMAPQLLNKPLLPTMSSTNRHSSETTGCDNTEETVVVVRTDMKRFPALFRSAQQAPRTSPSGMLIGLLATTIPGSVGLTLDEGGY